MNIKDALQFKGRPFNIPDAGRDDLPEFFVEMGYKVGAEIGTRQGLYAEVICKAGLKLYCVDPWLDYPDYSTGRPEWQSQLNSQYEETKKRLAPYNVNYIRKLSMDALNDIADESLDFVYIDGNHDFVYVINDIHEWSKKVKKGGCISGHDYFYHRGHGFEKIKVKEAVDSYTTVYNKDFYVIGEKNSIEGHKRDKHRSWFFIKE